ncbi:MAG: purine-nucleoside phosphorylase [Acidobacteria bacterium]|nr:MAG: purine-nucleoside phosphorylase [Acidobacteriota bacterium]REK04312.1 MAG: purine-nucleoside phosphorylase [Acidobacteriota bacterium]
MSAMQGEGMPAAAGGFAADLERAAARWREQGREGCDLVVVSGSGLSVDLEGELLEQGELGELTPFPVGGIVGHPLAWELRRCPGGARVLYYRGRLHAYQGYDTGQVVFALRLAALLGAHTLIVSNASGGIASGLEPGDLVCIEDQINLTGLNPLRGELPAAWGPQFPPMSNAYSERLREVAAEVAAGLGVPLAKGVYAGLLGPSYETPAEIRYLRTIGGDLVGMSTVLEVIAAVHMGLRCLGISLVTNTAAGLVSAQGVPAQLDHDDVLEVSARAAERFQKLLGALIADPRVARCEA